MKLTNHIAPACKPRRIVAVDAARRKAVAGLTGPRHLRGWIARSLPTLICATVVVLAGNVALAATPTREQRAFDAATAAFADGMWGRAEREFADFAERYPKSALRPQAVLLQAQSQYRMTNSAGAVELLTSNFDRSGPLADEYLFWTAEAYFQDRNYPAASAGYARLVMLHPDSVRAVESVLGEALARSRMGQNEQMIDLLTKSDGVFARAVRTRLPNSLVVRGLLLLGEAQLERRDFGAAEAALAPLAGQVLSAELEWQVQRLRCRILLAQDRAEEAWLASTNLPVLAASSAGPRSQLVAESVAFQVEILERLNRLEEAITVLQSNLAEGIPVERQREALLRIAEFSFALGSVTEARQTLNTFLRLHTNSPAIDMVYLALGELDLKLHAAGVQMGGIVSTNAGITNRLQRATAAFDELLRRFPDSSLAGRARLNKGWCLWESGDPTNSLPLFKSASEQLPPSEDQAVARFKWADAQMAVGDFDGALAGYSSLIREYGAVETIKAKYLERALYLAVRAAVRADKMGAGSEAMAKILDLFPNGFAGDRSLLLAAQSYVEQGDVVRARELFDDFARRWPESPLLPQLRLAIARSHERQGDWLSAVGKYDEWLVFYTNNAARPQAEFYRAWAVSQAGHETNALTQFTNFVARFSTNDLAPAAQWWVADFFFRQGDFENAEKNYKLLFQNWPGSSLTYEARMMAGRAALGRAAFPDAIGHFTNLTSRQSECPPEIWSQAVLAYGDTLMQQASGETNKFARIEEAIRVFGRIHQINATNAQAALAWGAIGNCHLQLGAKDAQSYDSVTNAYQRAISAYQRAINLPAATVTVRSQAQVGIGLALEKMAAAQPAGEQDALLEAALSNYLDVVYEKNLHDGDVADSFWVKKAGLEAARLIESSHQWEQAINLYRRLQTLLPPLRENLEKKIARAREQLNSVGN
jgi:TolA-binding protein